MAASVDRFLSNTHIAYFSMEIAVRNEMHTYSGGLGVLAGDTARSCADLQVPVVFVSLASHDGYLRQELDDLGRQIDAADPWPLADWTHPLAAKIAIELEGRAVWVRPWLYELTCPLGHCIPIILLDTNLEENSAEDREITARLYGGDSLCRLRQEAVLGIGGVRVLQALGFSIHTYHMNEGHAAFLTLELLRRHRRPERFLDDPLEPLYDETPVMESCIFTTHTPVEAGHDKFSYEDVAQVLGDFVEATELRRYAGDDACNMTQLALKLSGFINGVAPRHAETTRRMFPGYHVQAISNGVHPATWTHPAFARLYDSEFPRWAHEPEILARADQLDDERVWQAHDAAKRDLIALVKARTNKEFDPAIPVLGFARRMTGYKRPELLFADLERLRKIHRKHEFQIVWAGKAHPRDLEGKRLIQKITAEVAELASEIRMAFLPNYDLAMAGTLVAGADVWLNTPLPPLEASGTSGMKAALNGCLNLSVVEGWWVDAWIEGVTGWAIGDDGPDTADGHAQSLYDKLEHVVLPLYAKDRARWIWTMKQSISKITPRFNSQTMMRRYATEAYLR
jgi:glycogen phosphorylase